VWVGFLVGLGYNEVRINRDSIFVLLDKGYLDCDFDLCLRDNSKRKNTAKAVNAWRGIAKNLMAASCVKADVQQVLAL
jgi:hypothetical protein